MKKFLKNKWNCAYIIFFSISSITLAGNGENIENEYANFVMFFSITSVILVFLLWTIYGKDKHVDEIIGFYPPEDYNSAEIGFFYKGVVNDENVISLLLYLANKGYIKFEKTNSDKFIITKIKDYDGKNAFEKIFFEGLFKKSSDVVLGKEFYRKTNNKKNKKNYNYLISILLSEIEKAIEQENISDKKKLDLKDSVTFSELYENFYSTLNKIKRKYSSKTIKKKIFNEPSIKISNWIILLIIIIFLLITVKPLVDASSQYLLIWILLTGFGYKIVLDGIYDVILARNAMRVIGNNKNPVVKICVTVLGGGILAGTPWFFEVLPCLLMVEGYLKMYIIGIISIAILMLFYYIMLQRTRYGNNLLAKIEGFKTFLMVAEKNQIENLVNENPGYFYDILPYAYALDVFDIWLNKFEDFDIKPPEWYDSKESFNINSFIVILNNIMEDASHVMTSIPSTN